MRIPQRSPPFKKLMTGLAKPDRLFTIFQSVSGPSFEGRYLHWDELRFRKPPEGLTHQEWWLIGGNV
jgi:hypothetical protein